MRNIAVIAALLIGLSAAVAADEFEEKALRIIELDNTTQPSIDMMDEMIRSLQPMMINQMYQDFTDQGKAVKRETVVKLVNEWRELVIVEFSEKMTPLLVKEYRKHFSVEEMDQMIQIMETPAYQTFSSRTPEIMKSAGDAGERLGQELGQKIMLDLLEKYPDLR
ncbi:DUF2059 domain-containing protein [Kordiimonas lipolytica]|uniref:DUF2059 domain-containing protein n=1 Tax=Kordiimonas lipolytica TaxID=1662421 RepID=A0ABV8UBF8_9PROT|nr:DUF2059 domain-containing protein [Kordiimonas lipolytica]